MGLLIILIIGILLAPAAYLIGPILLLGYYFKPSQRKSALLFFFFTLILSDNLNPALDFFKTLRIECLVILFLVAIHSMLGTGKVDKNIRYILPFVFSLFISLVFSPTFLPSGLRTLSYLFLPVVVFQLFKKELFLSQGVFLRDFVLFGSLIIIIGHLIFLINPALVRSFGEGTGLRISGVFGNPNGLAIFCFLLYPITLLLRRAKFLPNSLAYFLVTLLIFTILLTGSRTSLGGILIFSAYWIASRYSFSIRFFLKLIIPIGIFLGLTLGKSIINENSYLSNRLRVESLESAGGRLEPWKWGYAQVSKNLFFGRGLVYDSYSYQSHFPIEFRSVNRGFNAAFSSVLGLLLDAGIIGVGAFLYFIYRSFSKFLDKKIIVPLFLALLLSWIFESWILATLNPFTIIFFMQIIAFQNLKSN